jgi:hypothetical protein
MYGRSDEEVGARAERDRPCSPSGGASRTSARPPPTARCRPGTASTPRPASRPHSSAAQRRPEPMPGLHRRQAELPGLPDRVAALQRSPTADVLAHGPGRPACRAAAQLLWPRRLPRPGAGEHPDPPADDRRRVPAQRRLELPELDLQEQPAAAGPPRPTNHQLTTACRSSPRAPRARARGASAFAPADPGR